MARNDRLAKHLVETFSELHAGVESEEFKVPCGSFEDFDYQTLKSWSRKRRVVGKAEVLAKGDNPRYMVTNMPKEGFWKEEPGRFEAAALYETFYGQRGDMENRIKEEQLDLFADRTSTHWMASNQLRLWFSAFAHLILSVLRAEVLYGTELARATVGKIRLQLFKFGARMKVSSRQVHFEHVTSTLPCADLAQIV